MIESASAITEGREFRLACNPTPTAKQWARIGMTLIRRARCRPIPESAREYTPPKVVTCVERHLVPIRLTDRADRKPDLRYSPSQLADSGAFDRPHGIAEMLGLEIEETATIRVMRPTTVGGDVMRRIGYAHKRLDRSYLLWEPTTDTYVASSAMPLFTPKRKPRQRKPLRRNPYLERGVPHSLSRIRGYADVSLAPNQTQQQAFMDRAVTRLRQFVESAATIRPWSQTEWAKATSTRRGYWRKWFSSLSPCSNDLAIERMYADYAQ